MMIAAHHATAQLDSQTGNGRVVQHYQPMLGEAAETSIDKYAQRLLLPLACISYALTAYYAMANDVILEGSRRYLGLCCVGAAAG
jgi:hypothetical protein